VDARHKAGHDEKAFKLLKEPENAGCFFGQALKELANGHAPTRWLNPRHPMFHLGNRQTAM
jgi:hypothetical protein